MHLEDEVELLVGHVEQHLVAGDAGVVDDHVEPTELLRGRLQHGFRSGALPHVTGHDERLDADLTDLLGCLLGCAGQVVEDHVRPGSREGERFRATEPGTGTGDDCDAPLE